MPADYLSVKTYEPLTNQKFRIYFAPDNISEAELIEVADRTRTKRQAQFSLLFKAPGTAPIEQGLYDVEHPELGRISLFLVPVGRDEMSINFEAVFNLLANSDESEA
jgi:uncharacterized protein DUF6916